MRRREKQTRSIENVKRLRARLHLTQEAFWQQVFVTQSAGSRYENGTRRIPMWMHVLIGIVHEGKTLEQASA